MKKLPYRLRKLLPRSRIYSPAFYATASMGHLGQGGFYEQLAFLPARKNSPLHRRLQPLREARALGFDIDYKSLLGMFQKQAVMVRAFYYTALLDDQEYSPIRPLVDWLDYNGWTIVTKPTKEFTDATGRRKIKATWTSSWPST